MRLGNSLTLDESKRAIEMRDSKRYNEFDDGFSSPFPIYFYARFRKGTYSTNMMAQTPLGEELLCC